MNIIESSVGGLTEQCVDFAALTADHRDKAIIVGFNIQPTDGKTKAKAEMMEVGLVTGSTIDAMSEKLLAAIESTLEKKRSLRQVGRATVREVFKLNDKSQSVVAGLRVDNGYVRMPASEGGSEGQYMDRTGDAGECQYTYTVIRNGTVLMEDIPGKQLKHYKESVSEVSHGSECGLLLDGFDAYEVEDEVVCSEVHYESGRLDPEEVKGAKKGRRASHLAK